MRQDRRGTGSGRSEAGRGRVSVTSARNDGFTLLELLVVLVIIGLLVGYVGPRYFAQIDKSKVKVARLQIKEFGQGLDQYRIDVGRYPSTAQGLAALDVRPAGVRAWQGPYLRHPVPKDPWGHPYRYREPGRHGPYDLSSRGPDDTAGSATGPNGPIGNWQQ